MPEEQNKDKPYEERDSDGRIIYTTTPEQFEYFKERCEYWVKENGVSFYKFRYSHEKIAASIVL